MYFLLASSTHPIYNKTKTLLQIYFPSANKRRNKLMTEHTICKESKYDKLKKKFSRIGSRIEDIFLSVALWLANILHSDKLNDWIESYTEKRMQNLQRQIIRQQYFTSCANTLAGRPCAYYFCFIGRYFHALA